MIHIKKIWMGGLFVVLLFTVKGCYYDQVIPVDAPVGDVGEVLFSKDILPIFNASCNSSGCHNGSVAPDLRPDKAYNALMSGNYINKADPDKSELILWMKGNKGLPMPLSGPDATYNAKVLAWIKQGALDN
jgi:hypothetical protein